MDVGEFIRQRVLPQGVTVTDAARQLGVGRPALSNLLNGRAALSPDMALRLEKAFGADRQELLDRQEQSKQDLRREADRRLAVQAHVPSFLTITARQISDWAAGNDARAQLPVLLRRLIHSTGYDLRRVDFPGYDNAQRAGWDGWVEAGEPTPWIPDGDSGWELSTNRRPKAKAEHDYRGRLGTVPAAEQAKLTFVFVTARNWPGKNDWAAEKEALGHWKAVRAFDASDLEQWLAASVTGQVWLAERLEIPLDGLETLDQSWSRWSTASEPMMTVKMFEPAVSAHRKAITEWLAAEPGDRPFAVAADSKDEALAFLYCLFDEGEAPAQHGDRVAVFDSAQTLRILASASAPFLLIVSSEEAERELANVYRRRHCIVVRPRNAVDREPNVDLRPLGREAFEAALADMEINRNDFDRWGRESGRSPTILRRRLSNINAIRTPPWAADFGIARSLIPLVMAGAWHRESSADCEILSALANADYQKVEETLARLLHLEDCPVWSVAEHRGVVSKLDALFAISRSLTAKHIEDFLELAEYVLSESDPSLELPERDRWAAGLYGKTRDHSSALRDGICETLVLLAVHGNDLFQRRLGVDVEQRVSNLVERLLAPLTLDKLLSHESDLPRYAEAAPNTFLALIEHDLGQSESALQGLLKPVSDPLFTGPSRTGLLWALECLAWSPQRLSRVSLILAQLALTEIDDNVANKPIDGLAAIYCCWMPQTAASLDDRIRGLELLVRRFPEVAWQICMQQIESHQIAIPSYRPRWRTDAVGAGEVVTKLELMKFACRALDLALAWPEHDSATLGDLIQRLSGMSDEYQSDVWNLIDTWSQTETDESAKAELREQIRRYALMRRGRGHSPETITHQRARDAYGQLAPRDPVNRHAWLFADEWIRHSVGDFDGEELDFSKREDRIHKLRTDAMADIWAASGLDGVTNLLATGNGAHAVGRYAAPCATAQGVAADVLRICLFDDSQPSQKTDAFMQGFIWEIHGCDRESILLEVASAATTDQKVRLLTCAPFDNRTWRLLEQYSPDVRDGYWREVPPRWNQHSESELNELTDRLLEVKRAWPAFHTASRDWDKIETSRLKRLLTAVATTVDADETIAPDAFDISRALSALDGRPGVTQAEMAQLEFTFIGALDEDESNHGIPNLEREIEKSPILFVQALAVLFKRDDDGDDPSEWKIRNSAQRTAAASAAYRLFNRIRRIPGTEPDGSISTDKLKRWVAEVRRLCAQYGRVDLGDQYIGQLLSKAPAGTDGLWPCRSVCAVMETVSSEHIARGFHIGVNNARGVHWRGEGGDQEREIAAKYRSWAQLLDFEFPYVSSVLERIASGYDDDASREDSRADVRRRMGHFY
ncbi:MAG: HigA family addiction module antitoxin [Chloroflexi bacterium]|nr:HigA family addiction module antitoxin [Chloroflexota bacterium]